MTITATAVTTRPAPADPSRNYARAGGIFYLLTFASSIPALIMLSPILDNADYIVGSGHDTQILWACLFDLVNALTAVGSAVAVFPVVKKVNESFALGFVMSRMIEATVIITGIIALLTVVALRQDFAASGVGDAASLTTTGHALVTVRDWTFLFGPGFMVSLNAILFGTLLYRSRLVPRIIPIMGLVGAPLLLAGNLLTYFGHNDQVSVLSAIATIPIFFWELSVGLYMTFKGFKRTPVSEAAI